ncbi:MAG TPA: prepilin-type N-terminal cleavage/methylation domain-containing protein [Armatimonadota bacterium]
MHAESYTAPSPRRPAAAPGAFSLIELLTVIAIIGVLAALIFPVLGVQQAKARRSACAANMATIAGGLRMYRIDTGYYPPALYGFSHVANEGTPGTEVWGLYPHWVRNATTFVCPNNPAVRAMSEKEAVRLAYEGTKAPILSPSVVPQELRAGKWTPTSQASTLLYKSGIAFAVGDSYDASFMPTNGMRSGNGAWERHYQLQWTPVLNLMDPKTDLGSLPLAGGTPAERSRTYARQLVFRQPDDSTVVTMCTYHRDYPSGWSYKGSLPHGSTDVVLFLDGHVEMRPSDETNVYDSLGWAGWQVGAK